MYKQKRESSYSCVCRKRRTFHKNATLQGYIDFENFIVEGDYKIPYAQ